MSCEWHNASRAEPCPVCHKTDWCTISNDGAVCVCRRVESDRPAKSGYGWVHRLGPSHEGMKFNSVRMFDAGGVFRGGGALGDRPLPAGDGARGDGAREERGVDFAALHAGFDGDEVLRELFAFRLGLEPETFAALDVRYEKDKELLSFPMRDAEGAITGLRFRHAFTGRKWSARGSKDGLFYDPRGGAFASNEFAGQYFADELVVLEGPSDTAAALGLGLPAVGRSACLTGAFVLARLVRRLRIRRLTIVADNDEPHRRPDGSWWRPGLDGAKRLAAGMRVPCRIVLPPPGIKDMRDWCATGRVTMSSFHSCATAAKWLLAK